jgi:hypothetical protein
MLNNRDKVKDIVIIALTAEVTKKTVVSKLYRGYYPNLVCSPHKIDKNCLFERKLLK